MGWVEVGGRRVLAEGMEEGGGSRVLGAMAAVAIEAEEVIRGRRTTRRRLELCGRDGPWTAPILLCELRSKGPVEPT